MSGLHPLTMQLWTNTHRKCTNSSGKCIREQNDWPISSDKHYMISQMYKQLVDRKQGRCIILQNQQEFLNQ